MTTVELGLRALNLFTTALVVGAMVVFQQALVPVLASWPADLSVRLHRDIVRFNPDAYIRPCGGLSLVSGVLSLVVADGVPSLAVVLTIVGVLCIAGVAVVSEALNQPINRRIRDALDGRPPEDHPVIMERWTRAHLLRTVLGVVGLAAFIIGALQAT